MARRKPDSVVVRVHRAVLRRSLRAVLPVEDTGSFASLLEAFDKFEREPKGKG